MRALVASLAFAVGIACGASSGFVCDIDAECVADGVDGLCQPGGHCSFPDETCTSGHRYGDRIDPDLAGKCVPVGEGSEGSSGGAGNGDATAGGGDDDGPVLDDAPAEGSSTAGFDPGSSTTAPVGEDDGSTSATTDAPEPIDPDLVLWLTFDDANAPLADVSSYAREVVCDACPMVADGAALFDGVDDLLAAPHDPALETDAGLTIAARVRNDAVSDLSIQTVMARPYGMLQENSWELFFRDEDGNGMTDVVFEIADPMLGQIQVYAPAPVAKGEWTRVVAVWAVDSVVLWFDGVQQGSTATTGMIFDDNPTYVGGDEDDTLPTNWFLGALDDVRVYRRVLSDAEITALP